MGPGSPIDFLCVAGDMDEFASIEHEKGLVVVVGVDEVVPGVAYGSFAEGTAR